MSLLAKAKAVPVRGRVLPTVDAEELDLVLGHLRGEVSQAQVGAAMDKTGGWVPGWAWRTLVSAVAGGLVIVEKRKAGGK